MHAHAQAALCVSSKLSINRHNFRLFTAACADMFHPQDMPEMQRVPLVDVCLMAKSLGVANVSTFLAAAPDPPKPAAVDNAIAELQALGALTPDQELTSLGRLLALLPGRWNLFSSYACWQPPTQVVQSC